MLGIGIGSGAFPQPLQSYNGQALAGNGIPVIVAKADALAQAANIVGTTLYTVPANTGGMYRITGYTVVTQAATTSSTLPVLAVTWTDNDTNTVANNNTIVNSSTGNTVGTIGVTLAGSPPFGIINVRAGTVIQYATFSYASVGATPMQYAVHIKLEYLSS